MPHKPYNPNPINSSSVTLDTQLTDLTERLAENTHDLWALERMEQGWKFGEERDDALKLHPCLISYEELPEAEKVFDRKTALGTLKAIMALGYQIQAPLVVSGDAPDAQSGIALDGWKSHLESASTLAKNKGKRAGTFDMDDAAELTQLESTNLKHAKAVLQELQTQIFPVWEKEDAAALCLQRRHHWIASLAIWPGVIAILCAILQLTARFVLPKESSLPSILANVELGAVVVAALAVIGGLGFHLHHGWLAHRQRAERLRILKFQALSWPELWCDFDAWKRKLAVEVTKLREVTTKAAHHWAKEKDSVRPELPEAPACVVPPADLQALSLHYRIKRLDFQRNYFDHQATKAHRSSWFVDGKFGLWIFGLSVVIVLWHGFHHLTGVGAHVAVQPDKVEILAISLAAVLPVIGFGFRAWFAAFEAPRSRNLYRAKALALDDYINRSATHENDVEQTLHHIAHGEHFFTNEHREWCRLQMEAEWFV